MAISVAPVIVLLAALGGCGGMVSFDDGDVTDGSSDRGDGDASPAGAAGGDYDREVREGFCRLVADAWEQRGPCSPEEAQWNDLDPFGVCMATSQHAFLNRCDAEWRELWLCRAFRDRRCGVDFGCPLEWKAYEAACHPRDEVHACGLCGDWEEPPDEWLCPCDTGPVHCICRED